MNFKENHVYHVYNRSNEIVFKTDDNYFYFLKKMKSLILPYSDILSWCLMPNHFHFLLIPNSNGCELINEHNRPFTQNLSKNIGNVISGYTRAFNNQNARKGKLFSHNTKAKCLSNKFNDKYILQNCFHYIHQNPVRAGLCIKIEDWEFSSVRDYAGLRKGSLVNKDLAYQAINLDRKNFLIQANAVLDEKVKKLIY